MGCGGGVVLAVVYTGCGATPAGAGLDVEAYEGGGGTEDPIAPPVVVAVEVYVGCGGVDTGAVAFVFEVVLEDLSGGAGGCLPVAVEGGGVGTDDGFEPENVVESGYEGGTGGVNEPDRTSAAVVTGVDEPSGEVGTSGRFPGPNVCNTEEKGATF